MYKKLLPLLTLAFILTATPVLANDGTNKHKNHGFYVSAEAQKREGGAAVSAVAKSDIGKHHGEEEKNENDEDLNDNDDIIVSPNPSASPTPSVSPSPSVEPSTSPSPSPRPSTSPTATVTVNTNVIQGLIDELNSLIASLKNLLS